jgi:hypothetical protein
MADAWYGIFTAENHTKLVCMKATTTPSTVTNWSSQDDPIHVWTGAEDIDSAGGQGQRAGGPGSQDFIKSFDVRQYNDNLHVVTQQESGRLAYHVFDTVSDTWSLRDETVALAGDTNFDRRAEEDFLGCTIAILSTGVVRVIGTYADTSDDTRLRLFTRTVAGVWSNTGLASNSTSTVDYTGPMLIGPDSLDRVTWCYGNGASGDLLSYNISSADAFGTNQQVDSTADTAPFIVGSGGIREDDTIYFAYVNSTDDVSVIDGASGSNPSFTITNSVSDADVAYSGATTPPFPQLSLSLRDNGDRQLLYVQVTNLDVYEDEDTGGGWGTDTVQTTTTATHLSANIFDDSLMWFYKATTLAYDEVTRTAETALGTIQDANGSFPDINIYSPPYRHSNGNLYVILSRNGNDLVCLRATTDPGVDADFDQLDGRVIISNDDDHNRYIKSLYTALSDDGNDIYVVTQTKSGRVALSVFEMDNNVWSTTIQNETVAIPGDTNFDRSPSSHAVAISLRSDGDVATVAAYENSLGFQSLRLFVRTSGTWANVGEASGGVASTDYEGVIMMPPDSSDRITWVYRDETNDDVDLRSVSSADSIAAVTTMTTNGVASTRSFGAGGINSSNVIYVPYVALSPSNAVIVQTWTSGASPSVSSDGTVSTSTTRTLDALSACVALRSNGDRHIIWSKLSDADLYRDVNTGAGYGTDQSLVATITTNAFSCVVNEPSAVDLDFVYLDSTTWHFGTVEIDAGVAPTALIGPLHLLGVGI